MLVKGRYFVIAWTTVFLAVAAIIVARDRRAFAARDNLATLRNTIKVLEGSRADLQAGLSSFGDRNNLGAKVAARGFHFASDADLILLPVPRAH